MNLKKKILLGSISSASIATVALTASCSLTIGGRIEDLGKRMDKLTGIKALAIPGLKITLSAIKLQYEAYDKSSKEEKETLDKTSKGLTGKSVLDNITLQLDGLEKSLKEIEAGK
ncbi:hypothetical protein [Mycoplasma crocodyli]|uniref:hypothetical protein n=1 Tax=Mycoplasma crocodyli TaxID=50052 RepID=UPI0002DB86B6|nr:hypothetical protein [Mycoplasma crocodyli]